MIIEIDWVSQLPVGKIAYVFGLAAAILTESALSYLGLGVQPPKASWGQMLNEYKDFLNTNKAYLTIIPGIAIMLLVLAFNLIGNGLRDALDVRASVN